MLGSHDLKCDKIFPCPDELKPRVAFWIDVFTRYGNDTIILHDAENPQRVYNVIQTKARCSRRNEAKSIKKAKSHVRNQLLQIADKRAKGISTFTGEQQHLAALVKNEKPAGIREAAKRIRCQGGVADQFLRALERHGTYGPMVVSTLKKAGSAYRHRISAIRRIILPPNGILTCRRSRYVADHAEDSPFTGSENIVYCR